VFESVSSVIVSIAKHWIGNPYCFGGGDQVGPTRGSGCTSTVGFDCTGLTLNAVFHATDYLLRHDDAQANTAPGGQRITSVASLQPGDIVYLGGTWKSVDHSAVYIGGGNIVDADTQFWIYPSGVYERSLSSETSGPHPIPFVGAIRY